jgi:microcystin-dependent protein
MTAPFLGEIRVFSYDFPPRGWAFCAGQLLAIAQNNALFSLLGTTYGGNGTTTFGLPDFRGRHSIHEGQGPGLSAFSLGQQAGAESVTLTVGQMPEHTHLWKVMNTDATVNPPKDAYLAKILRPANAGYRNGYAAPGGNPVPLGNALASAGGSQPHDNMQPYLVLNYSIALQGIFPSQN